ncbi:hypothetical protein BRD14_07290 [Halobacteriales archaeon SW_5_68_122]|nr:MAG: hypothetical protein BRD14_07290 [Halobacteriales archaeon SW_5_68_122]
MVEEELTDGERIARLLSSEVHGHERGALGRLSVVDAADDVDPTEAGTFAYAVADGERRVAEVYAHPDRAHVEFLMAAQAAAEAGQRAGLRVRPKAVDPPRTLAFVENGAEVKPALRVVRAVCEALEESG